MSDTIWWPSLDEYNPNISKEKWLEILDNRDLTTEQNLHVLACIYNYGGEATCTQLAQKYGETKNTYNSGSSNYAERIVKANICAEPPYRENENSRWWPVLYVGHDADKDTPGSYVWKLRDELKEACKEYGIEKWLNVAPFDIEAFKKALDAYKKDFNNHIDDEIYKWQAIKQFQDNWNIDAENFLEMLDKAFSKTSNLLANVNNFPLAMLKEFCGVASEDVRSAFKILYDESLPVSERIQNFINVTDKINSNYKPDKSTFQSINAISTYLWLRYPDKYIIYKYSEIDSVSRVLNALYEPESGSIETVEDGFNFYEQISAELRKDPELIEMLKSKHTDDCYSDPELKTLTIDFGFFISRYYHKNWITPCNPNDYDIDGAFKKYEVLNWKQSRNYSVGDYVYIYISTPQKRISYKAVVTKIDVPAIEVIHDEEFEINNEGYKDSKKMEIKLIGTSTDEGLVYSELKKQGLKSNLQSAEIIKPDMFEYIDSFFAEGNKSKSKKIWKLSHGKDFTEEDVQYHLKESTVCVHKNTGAKGVSSLPQGKAFTDEAKSGDLFYLCRGNQEIILIGEFVSDEVEIDDDGWAYKKYKKLYSSIKEGSYQGPNKWWTPNNNSTFIEIKQSEYPEFEELILIPFFGIDLQILNLVSGDNRMNENIEKYKELLVDNKNIILHGAPGTGKTYLAKQIAEAMGCSKDEIGFCQFHPSYDYTDFVEGLRPTKNNGFERQDGVLKEFCADAIENLNSYNSSTNHSTENSVDVHELFSQFAINIEKKLMESEAKMLPFSNTMKIKGVSRFKNGEVRSIEIASSLESPSYQNLTSNVFYRDYQNFKDGLITSYMDIKPLRESRSTFHGNADYLFTLYGLVKDFENSTAFIKVGNQKNVAIQNAPKNYVFIIDEINRGELSKIFGELFFSIDPGYRGLDEKGNPKGLVKTQYQNLVDEDDVFADGFFIPDNVYIIGTMNDIDRSVESMDFAMRRRFTFVEVTAEESAENMNITGEALQKMNAINKVISKMPELGKAYCIGAAYFKDAKDLQKLWDLKISSLVYEYLRGIDNYTDEHKDGEKFDEIKSAYDNPDSVA